MAKAKWDPNKDRADLQRAGVTYDDATVTYDDIDVYYDGYDPTTTTPEGENPAKWSNEALAESANWNPETDGNTTKWLSETNASGADWNTVHDFGTTDFDDPLIDFDDPDTPFNGLEYDSGNKWAKVDE